jgi:hypothetical protein
LDSVLRNTKAFKKSGQFLCAACLVLVEDCLPSALVSVYFVNDRKPSESVEYFADANHAYFLPGTGSATSPLDKEQCPTPFTSSLPGSAPHCKGLVDAFSSDPWHAAAIAALQQLANGMPELKRRNPRATTPITTQPPTSNVNIIAIGEKPQVATAKALTRSPSSL